MLTRKQRNWKLTALVFGLLPCVVGLGAVQALRWSDIVWLSTGGGFWPVVLAGASIAILIRLFFSDFDDRTSGTAAWLTLVATWFYVPAWAAAIQVPYAAAVISKGGNVHNVRETARYPGYRVWFLTDRPGTRIVHNVAGKVTAVSVDIEYSYADPYIATRQHGEDLSEALARGAGMVLNEEAQRTRESKIALFEDRTAQDRAIERICRATVGDGIGCPLKIKMSSQVEATAIGAVWSRYYSEKEAIAEKHLPTLVHLLTKSDSPIADTDGVFALLLELAETAAPLSQVAQKPYFLSDDQFGELIRRIMRLPGCGDEAVAILSKVKRLSQAQRQELRAKAFGEASIAKIVAQAGPLRITDAEIAQLAPRMRVAFQDDPGVAVRSLEVFGDRLPEETQRDAVGRIVKAKASYALAALAHVNFSDDLRGELMKKVLADAGYEDFSVAGLTKESLQSTLIPTELKSLIAKAIRQSDTSKRWFEFALTSLPISAMTLEERQSLLTGLLFESPKAAVEFVSKNRAFLEPAEVNEVTRGYARTIETDFCLHLSHRNRNWRVDYFSEDQLQIFRECAERK